MKRALDDDFTAFRNKVSEMKKKYILKCEELASLIEAKHKEISALFAETSSLRVEITQKLYVFTFILGSMLLFGIL